MKQRWMSFRNLVAGAIFVAAMGFGAMQAVATDTVPGAKATCNSWACRQECAPFGGQLGPGGPGKPLQCYCCG